MARRARGDDGVHSITHAKRSHSDDLDYRVTRYLISMAVRTLCLILVIVIPGPLRWAFAAGAVFLPYVAVVMANAGYTRRVVRPPTAVVPGPARGAVEAAPDVAP